MLSPSNFTISEVSTYSSLSFFKDRIFSFLITPFFIHTNFLAPQKFLEYCNISSSSFQPSSPLVLNTSVNEASFLGTQFQTSSSLDQVLNNQSENTHFFRYQRALNPVFKYDYKLGNYFTKQDSTMTPFMFTTAIDVTGGIRKSSWFFSSKFSELFDANLKTYLASYSGYSTTEANLDNPYTQNTFGFYNLLYNLQDEVALINYR
jgi:hypothetical protein